MVSDQARSFNFSLQDTLDASWVSVCKTVPSSTFSHRCEKSFAKCIKLISISQSPDQENMQFPIFFKNESLGRIWQTWWCVYTQHYQILWRNSCETSSQKMYNLWWGFIQNCIVFYFQFRFLILHWPFNLTLSDFLRSLNWNKNPCDLDIAMFKVGSANYWQSLHN